jgi:penicillin-binding protein 1C
MRNLLYRIAILLLVIVLFIIVKTFLDLAPVPQTLSVVNSTVRKHQVLDRHENPLTITYQNDWNLHDFRPLYHIPELLQKTFILSEDKRFYEHIGFDWRARLHAMWQDLRARRIVRGASTITEQVVRMIYPRPRTFWSRWVEGFDAIRLEWYYSKADILEFYLNQVPYANQRRGAVQAARYYFDRDLETLNIKEMMALAILVRSPSRLDLKRGTTSVERLTKHLAKHLLQQQVITATDYNALTQLPLQLKDSDLALNATHFVNYLYASQPIDLLQQQGQLHTTLDSHLQGMAQQILDQRLADLRAQNVNNGAMLVVDHTTGEILAWANAGSATAGAPSSHIDAVTTVRQPGSALKPFLYALALEKGWTAATLISDTPLTEAVGTGIHRYRNYSRQYYGQVRLRDALGNSLNIPAIRTVQFVGVEAFLERLRQLGMHSLDAHPDFYGDGLALGNGGVTLFELAQAYTTLAHQGMFRPLKTLRNAATGNEYAVFSPEITSIIGDILSDPDARRLEFGQGTLLQLPVQTAVKTGTSTNYRDAWAMGFNHHYTVGVWLGNLDDQAMSQVSGATGAALILRSMFAELNRLEETLPLYLSPKLAHQNICHATGELATATCPSRNELFIAGTAPISIPNAVENVETSLYLRQPNQGLQLAMDPRIPDDHEAFKLVLSDIPLAADDTIEWVVDDKVIGTTTAHTRHFLWYLSRGAHIAQARVRPSQAEAQSLLKTPAVEFYVK